jgi:peptidylprolyl isomerase
MQSKLLLSLVVVLFMTSCKDKLTPVEPEPVKDEESKPIKSKQERLLEKTYRVQYSTSGDTLLPYIPQDSIHLFFGRYGKQNPERFVTIYTEYGDITLELFEEFPLYRSSFIFLVKNKYFDLTEIYRVVPEFVVQAGNSDDPLASMRRTSTGNYKLPPRFDKNFRHVRGSLSLAKKWKDNPEDLHNPFDFFITLSPSPHLDDEHTIFGRVVDGIEVADKISQLERDSTDWPKDEVYIKMKAFLENPVKN